MCSERHTSERHVKHLRVYVCAVKPYTKLFTWGRQYSGADENRPLKFVVAHLNRQQFHRVCSVGIVYWIIWRAYINSRDTLRRIATRIQMQVVQGVYSICICRNSSIFRVKHTSRCLYKCMHHTLHQNVLCANGNGVVLTKNSVINICT